MNHDHHTNNTEISIEYSLAKENLEKFIGLASFENTTSSGQDEQVWENGGEKLPITQSM